MHKTATTDSVPVKYPSRFGIAAVKLGFITQEQLHEAMIDQLDANLKTNIHPLIGEILHSKGWMTLEQIEKTLESME
jgi:hypothetical protein